MVATAEAPGFVPVDRPRVAIASDGTIAAIAESTRVVVLEVPSGAPFAEIGIDPEATANDIAWVGAPPRLLVLSRFATHSTAHLIDPYGPRTIAEIRLEAPMKLFATVGAHALAVGAMGTAVLAATETHLTPYQFPSRVVPATAGAAGSNFVVALTGSIEEWDPQSRMPKRRLKLPRPSVITHVGGSDRVVWMTTQQDPTRLEVIPLVNRGQPKQHDLPEPIAFATGHPRSDLVVCVGADSGRIYIVDLDGRTRLRVIAPDGIERTEAAALVVGRMVGVLAAQARRRIAIVTLEGREPDGEAPAASTPASPLLVETDGPRARSTLFDEEAPAPRTSVPLAPVVPAPAAAAEEPAPTPTPTPPPPPPPAPAVTPAPAPPAAPAPSLFRQPPAPVAAKPAAKPAASTTTVAQNLAERFGAWRERMRQAQPRGSSESSSATLPWIDPRPSWRDEVVTWARAVAAGSVDRGAPSAPPIEELANRFELPPQLVPALVLLYGAHLGGERGAAPVDVARVLGRRWDEALGKGLLAERSLATYIDSRVQLAPAVQRALDELPVTTGTLIGTPGAIALLGPCVVVSASEPLTSLAQQHLANVGGAILAGSDGVDAELVIAEARARGAAPMVRIGTDDLVQLGTDPAILVVTDEATADALGIPRLA